MMKKLLFGLAATLFTFGSVRADRTLSDFNGTGFSSIGSGNTELIGPAFDTVAKGTGSAVAGDLNYEPDGLDLTGLTGFNVTYTLTLGAGSSPTISLGFYVRDLDSRQVANFVSVPASATFVTAFVPITAGSLDLTRTRFVRFSSSDFNGNGAITYQVDNIAAVGVAAAPEPQAWMLALNAIPLLFLVARRRLAE